MFAGVPEGEDGHVRSQGAEPISVAGVAVHPPVTERQALRLVPDRLLADCPEGLSDAWRRIVDMWAPTWARARRLPAGALDERADGEWSFLETQRHLIMVTDGWVCRTIEERPAPYHRLGVPPHFITSTAGMGLDLEAKPTSEEVLGVREERMQHVHDYIDQVEPAELGRVTRDGFTVLGALQVVIFEEWAHHVYATRDLGKLEPRANGP